MALTKQQEEAKTELISLLDGVDRIYTILEHTSSLGTMRAIKVLVIKNDSVYHINHLVCKLLGKKRHPKYEGVIRHGVGMDMGFDLVYTISMYLYGDGYALRNEWL